jgi:hypothetical protein
MIKIDAEKYLLELTFNCLDNEDGIGWWDYDVYLFDKIENKVIFSTKDNLFHDLTYNHMELHYDYDIGSMIICLEKILNNYNKPMLYDSCELELGFKYTPSNFKTFTFEFILFEQRLREDKIIFTKDFTREELLEFKNQFKYEFDQHVVRMKK